MYKVEEENLIRVYPILVMAQYEVEILKKI